MEVGVNLYGLVDELHQNKEKTLEAVAEIGFSFVEVMMAFEEDYEMYRQIPELSERLSSESMVEELIPQLENIGIVVGSCHIGFKPGTTILDYEKRLIDFAKRTGIRNYVVSLIFGELDFTKMHITAFNEAVPRLEEQGIHLMYHNHFHEFAPIKELNEESNYLEYFLANTKNSVKLQLDIGWVDYTGRDVTEFVKNYCHRISALHLKDLAKNVTEENLQESFVALGKGRVPIKEILQMVDEMTIVKYGIVIDQDKSNENILEDLRFGWNYCQKENKGN